MAIMEISVVPLGTGTTSVSQYVARAVKVLQDEPDLKYGLTAMGTIVEGDLDRVLGLARRMHQAVLDAGVMRVVTTIKIDDRRDKISSIDSKVTAVKNRLKET